MENDEKLQLIIGIIIAVVLIGAFLNIPNDIINLIVEWLVSIFVGILLSMVSGAIVESFTGDILKKILIPIEIKGIKFSISVFTITTFIAKIVIFGF